MIAIPSRVAKLEYLLAHQRWNCAIALEQGREVPAFYELHHRLHDTGPNRNKYPLLIHSLINLRAVNHNEHMAHPSALHMGLLEAMRWEGFLQDHPAIAAWANDPCLPLFTSLRKKPSNT